MGLGLDAVEIERFEQWPNHSISRLQQIFSQHEINYASKLPLKAPERFAARFAAKEAAYKALAHLMPVQISLIAFCKLVQVINDSNGAPYLQADFNTLKLSLDLKLFLSITHTQTLAMAVVVAELP